MIGAVTARTRLPGWLVGLGLVLVGVLTVWVDAHSVGQVQTTKYFAPETVNLLVSRASSGTPGFQVGDTINYIIQFTPVANNATVGAGGYITDYIPVGTQVVDAAIVEPDGSGNYSPISPDLPGTISNGWGAGRGQQAFNASWTGLTSIDTATRNACTAAGYTLANCNASLAQIYADTGIFYSTDSRTAVYTAPSTDGRVRQGCTTNTPTGNGYNLAVEKTGQLNPIIGQSCTTTHNLWDADQANAFGSKQANITALASPKSAAPSVGTGLGATPYNAGSAVAGPDAGYRLDNTGNVGPWRRVAYMGSRVGNPTGPATNATTSNTSSGVVSNIAAIVGQPTSAGWTLSPSNPLPSNTNAVRWAVGQLVVGQLKYVKISLRLTAPIPAGGLINNSEVFGGDSAEAAGKVGQDSPWPYHVPSVADNTTNLFVVKTIKCVFSGSTCVPSDGSSVAANAKIRYSLTYLNTSNGTQTNVVLSDTLPCQTAANAVTRINVVSGVAFSTTPPTTAAGNCGAIPPAGATFSFATIPSLASGQGGTVEVDVQTNAATGSVITNRARLVSTEVPAPGSSSSVSSSVINTANLQISKTTSTPTIGLAGTATYTITVTNIGAAAASTIVVNDFLPTTGGALNAATRFAFVTGSSTFAGLTAVTPTVVTPPTIAPYTGLNREQVTWTFTGQTLAAGSSLTITFSAKAGSSVPASVTPYLNDAQVSYNNTVATVVDQASAAAPVYVGLTLSGRVFEDYNYGGGPGRAFNAASGMAAVPNARIELYGAAGAFLSATSTDANGNYSFSGLSPSTAYTVRAVNGTIASNRPGGVTCAVASTPCIGVQTYRTTASTGTVTAVPGKVGGENPALVDAGSNLTAATLSSLSTASVTPESVTSVSLGSSNLSGLDFGFNFDTIVSTRNTGQGSLAQFIINANALGGEAALAQSGSRLQLNAASSEALPAGKETSIFMIPSAALTGGVATIGVSSALPAISGANATNTVIDGSTQTVNIGDTNAGQLGAGGKVGVDALDLLKVNRPEVQITGVGTLDVGLDVQANNTTIRGLAITGFSDNPNTDTDANIRIGNSTNITGALLENNVIGTTALSFSCPSATALSGGDNVRSVSGDNGTIQYNLIGCAAGKGIGLESTSLGWTVRGNEVRGNAIGQSHLDGMDLENASGNATVTGNLFAQNGGVGVDSYSGAGGITISNNTITGNGIGTTNSGSLPNETFGVRLYGTGSTVSRNLIFDNYGAGVGVTSGSSANTISQNSIYGNGTILKQGGTGAASAQIGIDLLSSADSPEAGTAPFVTLNDLTDGDTGGNGLLNYPVLERAVIQGSNLVLTGFSRPGANLEFFIAAPDPSGFGEGQTYLFSRTEGVGDADAATGSYGFSGTCASPATATPVNGIVQGCDTTNRFSLSVPLSSLPAGATLTAGATKLTATATLASATSEFSGLVTVLDEADLSITKTDGVTSAIPGSSLTYTITVTNNGLKTVTGATVTDTLASSLTGASWTCAATGTGSSCAASGSGSLSGLNVNLAAGGKVTFTVTATVDPGATGSLVNQASVAAPSSVLDPDLTNNTATDTDTLTPRADLSLTKTVSNNNPAIGTNVTFTVTVSNAGPSNATGISVKDLLPAGLTLVSSTPSQGSYASATGIWTAGSLASGSSATLNVVATVTAKPVTNTAEITASSATDPDSTPNNGVGNGEDDQASVTISGANLSGTVFEDANHNGIRDSGEPGLAGVTLTLSGPSSGSVTTDTNGNYTFTNLVPGAYTLTETDPSGYISTTPNALNVSLASTNITSQDFGDYHGSRVTGTVFRDDGLASGTANNAIQDGGEPGIPNLTVTATAPGFSTTAISDANGQYTLWVPFGTGSSLTVSHSAPAPTGTNIAGGSVQLGSSGRTISGFSSGQVYALENLGLVRPSVLQPDQTGQTSTPGAIAYTHLYRPGTLGTVSLGLIGTPGWGYLFYFDANCDGTVSATEHSSPVTGFSVTASWPREADGRLKACALEVVVSVPSNVAGGTVDRATVSATLTYQNDPAIQDLTRVVDATTALLGGRLVLTKTARNCGNLAGPSDPCSGAYSSNVSGKPGDVIEYRIEYRNAGSSPIGFVVINDPVPSFTSALPSITWTRPDGSSLTSPDPHLVLAALGLNVIFDLPGSVAGDLVQLQPGETGFVLYRVRVR